MAHRQPVAGTRDLSLLIAMLKLASLISRPMRDGVADPASLSFNELRILLALHGQGEAAGHDLAELMGMQAMNVSRALASLRRMGLARPAGNRANRRRKPYRLTALGQARRRALSQPIDTVARFLFCVLSRGERRDLGRMLARLERQVLTWQPREKRPHVPRD